MNKPTINEELCKGCGLCASFCPRKIITLSDTFNPSGYHYAYVQDQSRCSGCGYCFLICPDAAIKIYRDKLLEKNYLI